MFTPKKTLSRSSIFTILPLALFLSACGGGGKSSNNTPDTTTSRTEPRAVTASDWQNTNILARENASGLTIEEQGSQLKFTITNLDIVSGNHTQIYLDTDNDPNTGYRFDNTAWAVTGVDYILENNSLFKSTTNDSSWSWNTDVGEVTSYTRTDTSVEIVVEKSLFKNACNNINAGIMARDEDWQISSFYPVANTLQSYSISSCDNVIDTTPPVLSLKGANPLYVPEDSPYFNDPGVTAIDNVDGDISANVQVTSDYFETHGELVDLSLGGTETELRYSVTDNAGNTAKITRTVIVEHRSGSYFTVDGDNREWGHIEPLIQANEGILKVVDDLADDNDTSDDTVVLLLEMPGLEENIQIYLDTDNNSETGYPLYDATIPSVVAGADFLIENGHLNKSLSSTFQWNWEYDTPLPAHPRFEYVRNGDIVEIKIPKHLVTTDKIKINIASIDTTWQQAVWFDAMTPAIFELLSTPDRPNNAPVAVDDSRLVPAGSISINLDDVLANDIDVDGDPLTITEVGSAQHGTVDLISNTVIRYTPEANYHGQDNFNYTISDGRGGTSRAIVNLVIEAPTINRAPDAVEDAPTTNFNQAITIDVLANDTDPDGDTLTITEVTQPPLGQTTLNSDGTILFDPQNNVGSISFSYTISDGRGGTDSTVVTVASSDPNDGNDNFPIITGENVSTPMNTAIFIDVLANDTDLDGDTLILDQVDSGSNGTTTKVDGGVLYTPVDGFVGTDTFFYGVHDGHGHNGAGQVTVTVTAVPN